MSDSNVVPFGKYKGQSFDVMLNDQSYMQWLKLQPWFRSKYEKLIIEMEDRQMLKDATPEHNRLQNLFLDADNRRIFLGLACYKWHKNLLFFQKYHIGVEFEYQRYRGRYIDVVLKPDDSPTANGFIEIKPIVGDDYPNVIRQMKQNGSDVLFVKEYVGTSATEDQLVEIFEMSKLTVVFLNEFEDAYEYWHGTMDSYKGMNG